MGPGREPLGVLVGWDRSPPSPGGEGFGEQRGSGVQGQPGTRVSERLICAAARWFREFSSRISHGDRPGGGTKLLEIRKKPQRYLLSGPEPQAWSF